MSTLPDEITEGIDALCNRIGPDNPEHWYEEERAALEAAITTALDAAASDAVFAARVELRRASADVMRENEKLTDRATRAESLVAEQHASIERMRDEQARTNADLADARDRVTALETELAAERARGAKGRDDLAEALRVVTARTEEGQAAWRRGMERGAAIADVQAEHEKACEDHERAAGRMEAVGWHRRGVVTATDIARDIRTEAAKGGDDGK